MCTRRTKRRGETDTYPVRLVYVIEEKQLTKESGGRRLVIRKAGAWSRPSQWYRKIFSHRRSQLPSQRLGLAVDQGSRELFGEQVVAFAMLHPQHSGAKIACDPGEGCQRRQGSAWNLKEHLRRGWNGAANSYQHSACGNIDRGGEFKEFLIGFGLTSHKHGNRQWQARPLSTVCCRRFSVQTHHPSSLNLKFQAY